MSVDFSIQGYKKDAAFITGQIRPLGAYEVDRRAAGSYRIFGMQWPVFHHGILSIDILRDKCLHGLWDEWGMYVEMWYFIPLAMDHSTGFALTTAGDKALGILFDVDPARLLIKSLNSNIDSLYRCFPADFEGNYEEEKENLVILEKMLSHPSMDNALIGCVWG